MDHKIKKKKIIKRVIASRIPSDKKKNPPQTAFTAHRKHQTERVELQVGASNNHHMPLQKKPSKATETQYRLLLLKPKHFLVISILPLFDGVVI
jgi:hypothetical protein